MRKLCRTVTVSIFAAVLTAGTLTFADADARGISYDLNIPSEDLTAALQSFAIASHHKLLYKSELTAGRISRAVKGRFTAHEAMEVLLLDTGLTYEITSGSVVLIKSVTNIPVSDLGSGQSALQDASPGSSDDSSPSKEAGKKYSQSFRVAQVDQARTTSDSSVERQDEQVSKKNPNQLEQVIVTGSRLPATAKQGEQDVKVYSTEVIEQSGQTTVADFLSTIPGPSLSVGENGFQSFDSATTIQLHGLPVGATLVLINGRRVETSGPQQAQGNFFDLNNIPLAAVDRIEVLSAGSSAIYGSDAIAGVVNIILKNNFDGLEVNAKYGWASGIDETSANVALGKHWDRGSASIIASYQTRGELDGSQRSITANQDYRRYGGLDSRAFACNPGNIFSTDGSNLPGVGAPDAGVPAGFTGKPTQQEFAATAGHLNECSLDAYISFIPAS